MNIILEPMEHQSINNKELGKGTTNMLKPTKLGQYFPFSVRLIEICITCSLC